MSWVCPKEKIKGILKVVMSSPSGVLNLGGLDF